MGEIGCNARCIYDIEQTKLFGILELYGIDGFERNSTSEMAGLTFKRRANGWPIPPRDWMRIDGYDGIGIWNIYQMLRVQQL